MTPEADLERRILALLRNDAARPLSVDEVVAALRLAAGEDAAGVAGPNDDLTEARVVAALAAMESRGLVVRTRAGRYGAPEQMNLVVGRLQGNPRGFGFVVPDAPGSPDVYVGRESLNGAWHGDRVVVRLTPAASRRGPSADDAGAGPAGEVIRILERANRRVVGTFHIGAGVAFVTPDERRLPDDILIPDGAAAHAEDGETVVVEVQRFPDGRRGALGQVVERLGFKGQPGVDVLAIIRRYDLPEAFPPEVLAEAEAIPDAVRATDLAGREDLRGLPIVTIDGEDAKDLDDAVSLERTREGHYRLGVHIADVSHYVREGSALDREARRRGTSIYLVDRVIPMLPHRLSNGICSLNPRVDRLTLTCFMDFDPDGRPLGHRLARTVIRTAERMTYTAVAGILERRDPSLVERYRDLLALFADMERLCRLLRGRRERRGSIDFNLPEEKVTLDADGKPVAVQPLARTIADQIIEEFMLRANETVAEEFARRDVPFLYRVHEEPDADEMAALAQFLAGFGISLRARKVHPSALREVLAQIAGRPEERLLSALILRSMKQARYAAENVGHFGLAAQYYTHFTSPIRRYPDLQVHRIITWLMERGRPSTAEEERWATVLPEVAAHCSAMERRADDAERETVNLKKAEFMLDHVGDRFRGLISGVTHFGIFVQLENTVEGLVHVSHMVDDYYQYLPEAHALVGRRRRRIFRLGDPVTVIVRGVSLDEARVDFELAGDGDGGLPPDVRPPEAKRAARRPRRAVRAMARGEEAPGTEGGRRVGKGKGGRPRRRRSDRH